MSSPVRPVPPRAVRRRRLTPLALLTGVVGAVVLAFSMNSSLAAFTASIVNTVNTVGEGTLIMTETGPAPGNATCTSNSGAGGYAGTNSATCATINKYGGSQTLVPGQSTSTTVTLTNSGTAPANAFTLTAGACTQSGGVAGTSATDLCSKLGIVITQTVGTTTTTVSPASSTLTSITAASPITLTAPVAAGASVSFTFAVTLPAASGNTYQGLAAAQQLTWTFTS